MKRKFFRTLVALVLAVSLCVVMAVPVSADLLTSITATPSDTTAGVSANYTIAFTTAVSGNLTTVEMAFPTGFDVTGVGVDLGATANISDGAVDDSDQVVTYTVTAPVTIADGVAISIQLTGIVNTQTAADDYMVAVTTKDDGGDPIDGPTNTASFEIVADVADHFIVVTANSGNEGAGVPFTVTLTAEDQFDNTAVSYTGGHVIEFSSTATVAPDGTKPTIPESENITFATGGGTSSANFTLVRVAEAPTIMATEAAITGTSDSVFVEGINLDSLYYHTEGTVSVTVGDETLAGAGTTGIVASGDIPVDDVEVALTETGASTGIFMGTFTLVDTSPAPGELIVGEGSTITVTYPTDSSLEVPPLNEATVDDVSPVFADVVSDADFYKNTDGIELTADIGEDGLTVTADFSSIDSEYTTGGENVAPTGGGSGEYVITYTIAEANTKGDAAYAISVTAEDVAGNSASDMSCSITLDNTVPVVTLPAADPVIIQPDTATDVTFTATVTDDGAGMSTTVTPVTIDLSDAAIGGSATQEMFDDGSNGDTTPSDGIYTYLMSGLDVAAEDDGTYYLVITATDNVSNVNATANITLRVIADIEDPFIVSTTVEYPLGYESAKEGNEVKITAVVTEDLTGLESVTIDATAIGDPAEDLTLTAVADTYEITLTVGAVDPDTYILTITATDSAANAATANVTVEVVSGLTAYNLDLVVGWNLISLPLIPDFTAIGTILASVSDNVDVVWGYDPVISPDDPWATYKPGVIEDDLTQMVDGMGYWVYMNDSATLTIFGVEMPVPNGVPTTPPAYDVTSGWNLIGVKNVALEGILRSSYLISIVDDYAVIWGYNTETGYFNVYPIGPEDFKVVPGLGYWLWMNVDGIIVPPQ